MEGADNSNCFQFLNINFESLRDRLQNLTITILQKWDRELTARLQLPFSQSTLVLGLSVGLPPQLQQSLAASAAAAAAAGSAGSAGAGGLWPLRSAGELQTEYPEVQQPIAQKLQAAFIVLRALLHLRDRLDGTLLFTLTAVLAVLVICYEFRIEYTDCLLCLDCKWFSIVDTKLINVFGVLDVKGSRSPSRVCKCGSSSRSSQSCPISLQPPSLST